MSPVSSPATRSRGFERLFAGAEPRTRLVFVNGAFSRAISTPGRGAFVATSIREALDGEHAAVVRSHLGGSAADGALVYVPEAVAIAEPIEVVFAVNEPDAHTPVNERLLVVLARGARATLVERFLAPLDDAYDATALTEIALGPDAALDHTRLVQESELASRSARLAVAQERGSRLASRTVVLSGKLMREEASVALGESAECSLDGLSVLAGEQRAEWETRIEHRRPRSRSRQEHRSVVAARARSTFKGRIVVAPDAQKTVAEQSSKSLLLSDDARADASPELEIHADDVKCAHGATVGRLNEDALFYMRSRGVDPGAARALLTYAFASELVERAPAPVRAIVEDAVRARLRKEAS